MSILPEITPWGADIIQLKIPVPYALKWVNSYLFKGAQGYTLLDPGLRTEEAEHVWKEALSSLGIAMTDIDQIVLTHHHPDHYGLAGWFQAQTGAPVYMSETAHRLADLMWGAQQNTAQTITELFLRHGMDAAVLAQITPHLNSFSASVSPQPEEVRYIPLHAEQLVRLGDRHWQPIETAGHASGHLCFYDALSKEMICGDQVIPQISPNVSYIPGSDPQPLHSFLKSLQKLQEYDVEQAYPGHRNPFRNFQERIMDLLAHHELRLSQLLELVEGHPTAYDCCKALFGTKLTIHQMRFAMAETMAHLIELKRRGAVEEAEQDGVIYFRVTA